MLAFLLLQQYSDKLETLKENVGGVWDFLFKEINRTTKAAAAASHLRIFSTVLKHFYYLHLLFL